MNKPTLTVRNDAVDYFLLNYCIGYDQDSRNIMGVVQSIPNEFLVKKGKGVEPDSFLIIEIKDTTVVGRKNIITTLVYEVSDYDSFTVKAVIKETKCEDKIVKI